MATDSPTPDPLRNVVDITKEEARIAAERASETVEDAELTLRDLGYAALGAADLAVETARTLGDVSLQLPQWLRQAPSAAATGYALLAARGRRLTGEIAGDETVAQAQQQTRAAVSQAKGAATTAQKSAETTTAKAGDQAEKAAATAREQTQQATSSAKGATTSASKAATTQAEAARSAAQKVGSGEAEPLEERTVDELRDKASDLDIEGRASMRKQELIDAIRKAK